MNNYSLHNKERGLSAQAGKRLFNKTFLSVLFVISVLIFAQTIFPNSLSGAYHFVSSPFWKAKNFTVSKVANSTELFRSKKALVNENNNLKAQIELNKLKLLGLDLFKQENIRLKELFDRQVSDTENSVLGVVLARPSVSMYDTFVIDIGRDVGIQSGDNVLVSGDIFLGVIDEVYSRTSVVKLFSSPGEVSVVSIGQDNISTEAKGLGGGNFIVKLPRGVGVEKGDIVTMPNISARIFAIVEEIESDPSDPFITILFKNPVNMNQIKWVQVVKSQD